MLAHLLVNDATDIGQQDMSSYPFLKTFDWGMCQNASYRHLCAGPQSMAGPASPA